MIVAFLKSLRDMVGWCFRAPYRGVPWLVWFYVIACVACYPHGGIFAGYLTGYDDPVRMTQVLNWVNGAGWYDRRIMRVDPPDGFQTIWSRLVDIPIALVILIAQQFVVQKKAVLIAALIIPLIELRILFAAAHYFVRPLVGKKSAALISVFLVFTTISNYHNFSVSGFYPGEASHHPWYIILALLLYGALARIVMGGEYRNPLIMTSVTIGLLLAVGIEAFPLMAGACALLIILSWHYKRAEMAQRLGYAYAGGALLGLVLLPTHQPPTGFFTISFVEPSILGPILIAAAALFATVSARFIERLSRKQSLAGIMVVGLLIGAGLILVFPRMLNGAAAGLSPSERAMALREHVEALPLHKVTRGFADSASLFVPLLIAFAASIIGVIRSGSPRRQALASVYLGFNLINGGMVELFSRYYHHAIIVACGWLLWLWRLIMRYASRDQNYNLIAVAVFVALGPFWMHFLPVLANDSPVLSQVVLFPAKIQSVREPCGLVEMADYLDTHYASGTNLLVPGLDSSRMLFATHLTIDFLNNYPSQDRFIDNETFFGTQDIQVAANIAQRHKVDLVVVCKVAMTPMPLKPGEEPMMFERLEAGAPPPWLKRIDTHSYDLYRLYEIDKAKLNTSLKAGKS